MLIYYFFVFSCEFLFHLLVSLRFSELQGHPDLPISREGSAWLVWGWKQRHPKHRTGPRAAQGIVWILTASRLHICIMMQMSDLITAGVSCLGRPSLPLHNAGNQPGRLGKGSSSHDKPWERRTLMGFASCGETHSLGAIAFLHGSVECMVWSTPYWLCWGPCNEWQQFLCSHTSTKIYQRFGR